MPKKIFDILVVGSGLSGLTFAEEYLKKNRTLNFISPTLKKNTSDDTKYKLDYKALPPQFKKNFNKIEDYFNFNKFIFDKKNCSLLGSLELGGLSNYWGLQVDKDIGVDLNPFGSNIKNKIIKCFVEILREKSLLGKFKDYDNDFQISDHYENLINQKRNKIKKFVINKSIMAIQNKMKNTPKLIPNLILKKIKKKIVIHNFFVEKIRKKKGYIYLYCFNGNQKKTFITKKLILGAGTLATTRLIMEYLNVEKEIPIKHHPRLISVYFGRKKIMSNLDITPGLLQIKNIKENYSGDIRPCSEMILNMAFKIYSILKPFKNFLIPFKNYIYFSNTLLGTQYSNLFIKKHKDKFKIYSKNKNTLKILKKKQKSIFNFLLRQKLVFPIFKNFFPGVGSDYHYFGTIPVGNQKLAVNKNCQLNNNRSIFLVDGSVFNFKKNLYPFCFVMANAKRIAKIINK